MDTGERTYTLHEARRELARQECAAHGHSWEVLEQLGKAPHRIICVQCGESHEVAPPAER